MHCLTLRHSLAVFLAFSHTSAIRVPSLSLLFHRGPHLSLSGFPSLEVPLPFIELFPFLLPPLPLEALVLEVGQCCAPLPVHLCFTCSFHPATQGWEEVEPTLPLSSACRWTGILMSYPESSLAGCHENSSEKGPTRPVQQSSPI